MRIDILKKIRHDESGATAIEYGLIAAQVSVAAIGALTAMGGSAAADGRPPASGANSADPGVITTPIEDGSMDLVMLGDWATALRELRPLAEQGFAGAQLSLGSMYHLGQGVPQDYAEAVRWYRKAAEQGYAIAQNSLGSMYHLGQGVPRDYA